MVRPGCRRAVALAAIAALLVAGCAERAGGGPPAGTAPDVQGSWELATGTAGGTALPQPAGSRATLVFEGAQVSGSSFCNLFGSTYRLDGDVLAFDGFGGTEMGCDPDVMAAERAYLAALGATETAAVEAGELLLTGDGVSLRFRRLPAVPTSDLADTEWVLETLIQGEVAGSVAPGAVLRLTPDDALHGSTGCRALSGTWDTRGDEVVVPALRVDGECPEELRAQDEHVLSVLGDGFRFAIEGDRLTASDADGLGLVYRAAT